MIEEKMTLNARGVDFLRPIFRILRKTNDLVLMECLYSRMAGHREIHLIDTEQQLKTVLRNLPPQTIVKWKTISYPSFRDCPSGIVPTKDGKLTYGAY